MVKDMTVGASFFVIVLIAVLISAFALSFVVGLLINTITLTLFGSNVTGGGCFMTSLVGAVLLLIIIFFYLLFGLRNR